MATVKGSHNLKPIKKYKRQAKKHRARYNPYLTHNGNKIPGWILPATKQNLLNSII